MYKYIGIAIIGILGLAFSLEAQAKEEQAPLIFEYNLPGPQEVESKAISTQGTIKAIAASWDFAGEARLEVSANGGVAYTNIINGQLLSEGFIPGNQLRFRAKVSAGSVLKKVILGYADTSGAERFSENKELSSFKYRKAIDISGSSQELFNYPVKIKLNKQDCPEIQEDFRDARFVASDGRTPLNYYLERAYPENGVLSADFWVKIPQVPPAGTKIYFYYGNKEAQGAQDAEKVFPFFDDFNSVKLDETKWQALPEIDKKLGLKDGYLELKGCSVISRAFRMKEGILEFKARQEKSAAIQAIVNGAANPHSIQPSEEIVYSSGYPGAEHTIAVNDVARLNAGVPIKPKTDYIYKVSVGPAGIVFERYSQDYQKQAEIRFLNPDTLREGYIGLKAGAGFFEEGSIYFDWVRCRLYSETEPVVSIEK